MSGKTKLTNMNPIIQTVLDAHFPGVAKPIMSLEDEITALAAELRTRTTERDAWRMAALNTGICRAEPQTGEQT